MFDLGWSEILVIAVIAILVVGPKDLPPLMKAIAQWIGKARQMAAHFQSGVDEMIRQSELDDLRKDLRQIHADLKTPLPTKFPMPAPSAHVMTQTGASAPALPPAEETTTPPNIVPDPSPEPTAPATLNVAPEPAAQRPPPAKTEDPTPAGSTH